MRRMNGTTKRKENPSMTSESLTSTMYQPTSDEKTWATLAHLSVLVNLFTGVLGPVIALVIYLAHKDKSRYVAYQSLQALLLQLVVWVGGGALIAIVWVITGLLSLVIIGLCLIPFAILLSAVPIVAPVYGVVGAIKTSQGEDFRYWLIGDWVRGTYTG
uniref:DUF4870 domain-containing protein n=1 Tax=Anaerolinea thermolimosa TaxID=229919 RepID=A0A7C4PKP0_9CHLR